MTERQAWALAARGVESGKYVRGLCPALFMSNDFLLGPVVEVRIRSRLNRLQARHGGLWKWPLDAAGQRARAAYCRRQVARLAPKRRKA